MPEVRYTLENPHRAIQSILFDGRSRYAAHLKDFVRMAADYASIPFDASPEGTEPFWNNHWMHSQDTIALTGMIQANHPALYLEVGSGNSTKFARRAVNLYSPKTKIISIDPAPRAVIDSLCTEVVREPLESVNPSAFDSLQPGDILFVDSSHVCSMNSDVTVVFMDIIPRLKPGVLVHFHDIFWPWEHCPRFDKATIQSWVTRNYTEQYLLGCYLLAGQRLQVEMPIAFVANDVELFSILDPLWDYAPPMASASSFWVSVR
jgi:hypothetical protein